jgi:pimeloyl-ACP methyl ester carboxylesterase
MGGIVVTEAAARCPEHIAKVVYVAAFLPAGGQSLHDLAALPEGAGDAVQANMVVDGDPPVAVLPEHAARDAVFGCCDDEQAAWGIDLLGPQPVAPFLQPVRGGLGDLPRAYISCRQDKAVLPALQRRMREAARCDPVIEIDTDHSPWVSRPAELVEALHVIAS